MRDRVLAVTFATPVMRFLSLSQPSAPPRGHPSRSALASPSAPRHSPSRLFPVATSRRTLPPGLCGVPHPIRGIPYLVLRMSRRSRHAALSPRVSIIPASLFLSARRKPTRQLRTSLHSPSRPSPSPSTMRPASGSQRPSTLPSQATTRSCAAHTPIPPPPTSSYSQSPPVLHPDASFSLPLSSSALLPPTSLYLPPYAADPRFRGRRYAPRRIA